VSLQFQADVISSRGIGVMKFLSDLR